MWRSTGPEDNENTLATGSSSNSIAKPPPVKPPPTLPTLSLDRPEEAAGPFCLDFGQVPLGQSKALPFAVAGASGRLEVERQPSDVQVTLSPRSGVVLWTPTAVAAGAMREAIVLLHAEQRVQIVVQGQAVSPESGASDARQPLRPAASNVNIGRASSLSLQQQQRPFLPAKATSSAGKFAGAAAFLYATEPLRASIAEDNCDMRAPPALPLPTPQRGRAAWEIGVEPFTPSSNKRRLRPPMNVLATPGPPMLPAAAATAAKPPATSVIKAKGARLGLPAASPRQERVLVEWLNHTLILPTPAQSLPHPAEFLKVRKRWLDWIAIKPSRSSKYSRLLITAADAGRRD